MAELLAITIPKAQISEFSRVDATSAEAKFRARPAPAQLKTLAEFMGWAPPSAKDQEKKLDGNLDGGNFILSAAADEKLKAKSRDSWIDTEAQIDVEYKSVSGFQLLRMEIQGKKKGFQWELRFKMTSEARDFATLCEDYMLKTDNAPGSLKIYYLKEDEQRQGILQED